jgi:signal transduction histidine kinase
VSGATKRRIRLGAALAALLLTILLAGLRLGFVGPLPPPSPDDLLRLLVAVALLLVVGLAHRTHPTLAWLATIGAAAVVAVDLAIYARQVRSLVDAVAWQWLAIAVSLASILAVATAAAYAASRPALRGGRYTVEGTVAATLGISGVAVWALNNPADSLFGLGEGSPIGSLGAVTRTFLAGTLAFTVVGAVGDALPSAERAWRRAGLLHPTPAPRAARVRAWLPALADELSWGRRRARTAVLAERSRLAADLHADVVPGLRRALADAERGAPPEALAASLRDVLSEVEAVGGERHAVQLDIGGLVPALAWLAERVERRSDVTVTIDVSDTETSPPSEVAAAAFRIAGLALTNVTWHAPGSQVAIDVRADADAVDLTIVDDGPGITSEAIAHAQAAGHRGIADMAAEAAACGGSVDVGRRPDGPGTLVSFRWRASGGDLDA